MGIYDHVCRYTCFVCREVVAHDGPWPREKHCPKCGAAAELMLLSGIVQVTQVVDVPVDFVQNEPTHQGPVNRPEAGHPLFEEITADELRLHRKKNADYAGGGRPLGNFERVAAILALYPGLKLDNPVVVAMVYMLKQLDCVLWMLATGREGSVEDIDARLTDAHVYCKLARILHKERKEHGTNT